MIFRKPRHLSGAFSFPSIRANTSKGRYNIQQLSACFLSLILYHRFQMG